MKKRFTEEQILDFLQDLASAPPASWVLPLATLRQDLASAPPGIWLRDLDSNQGPND